MSKKQRYRIRNWKDYNEALVNRGNITFWFNEEAISQWHQMEKTKQRGRPKLYTNMAIICALTLREVYHLPLRGTEGLVKSLIQQLSLPLKTPDYTTLCIRQKDLDVFLPKSYRKSREGLHIVVDSTGFKIFGEGEWKVRQHGYTKRRTWRKVHLAVDVQTQEIEAAVITTNDFKDSELLPDLLDQINGKIDQLSGDGGYDSHDNYQLLADKDINAVIPPRRDACIRQHGNCHLPPIPRDEVIREIRQLGRKAWKIKNGYHKRSLVETAMFRLKTIFSDHLRAQLFEHQATESLLRCRALNLMTQLGMPNNYAIA